MYWMVSWCILYFPLALLQYSKESSKHSSSQLPPCIAEFLKYVCHNSDASLIFRASNGKEISATQTLYDGCKVISFMTKVNLTHLYYIQTSRSVPDVSILEVNTKKVNQLPLKDFTTTSINRSGQEFGFVMGPACFY